MSYMPHQSTERPSRRPNQIMTVEELDALPIGTVIEKVYSRDDREYATRIVWRGRTDGSRAAKFVSRWSGGAWYLFTDADYRRTNPIESSLADACVIPYCGKGNTREWNLWNYLRMPFEEPLFSPS